MKVLLVSREFPGYSPSGGIGTYTRLLASALARMGVTTHVLCVRAHLRRREIPIDGFVVHTAPQVQPRGVGRITQMPATLGRLAQAGSVWREFRRLRLDVDVVEAPELNAEGLLIALATGVPLVVRLHSSAAQLSRHSGGEPGLDLRWAIALEEAAIRRAQIVVSTTPNLREQIPALGLDRANTREIIYPVEVRSAVPVPSGPPIVLFVGRLEPRKGTDMIVKAAPEILKAFPDARCRFVGEDTSTPSTRSYAGYLKDLGKQLGVEHALDFMGPRDQAGVFAEMAAAAVCAFPSRWESFGLVAAEAASIGRPVVVSAIPGFLDYVEPGRTAYVAAAGDVTAWVTSVVRVLRAPDLARQMALRLRDELVARANPERVAALAVDSYEAAIARHQSE